MKKTKKAVVLGILVVLLCALLVSPSAARGITDIGKIGGGDPNRSVVLSIDDVTYNLEFVSEGNTQLNDNLC